MIQPLPIACPPGSADRTDKPNRRRSAEGGMPRAGAPGAWFGAIARTLASEGGAGTRAMGSAFAGLWEARSGRDAHGHSAGVDKRGKTLSTIIPESPNPRIPESPNPRIPESPNPRIPESPSFRLHGITA